MMDFMTSSGSREFDQLSGAFASDAALRQEMEWAYRLAVETYNPSDRGLRFITGGIGEWIITLAAYRAGLVTLPDGHNADGHDTASVLDDAKGLWSVKTSYRRGGNFTITNGQGGAGAGLSVATVFLSPDLPGIVLVSPDAHHDVVQHVVERKDATTLAKSVIAAHAAARPECVIPFQMPENPGSAIKDPALEAVRIIVDNSNFPRLRTMFAEVAEKRASDRSTLGKIREVKALRDEGTITEQQFRRLIEDVTGVAE